MVGFQPVVRGGIAGYRSAVAMLFIHPMWDNESQRIGKQKCTPAGYALHVIAEMVD